MKIFPLALVGLAVMICVCSSGCLSAPFLLPKDTLNEYDPILGTFEYSLQRPFIESPDDLLYDMYYVFSPKGEGVQYWIASDGSGAKLLQLAWTNLGNNVYSVKFISPGGDIYGEYLVLAGDSLIYDKNMSYLYENIGLDSFNKNSFNGTYSRVG